MEARVEGFLDVTDIVAVAEVLMDEAVDVAQLQLDGSADVIEAHHLRAGSDDFQAALYVSQMVVGQLQDKQLIENIRTGHDSFSLLAVFR
jgi:hypothetical protein